MYVRSLEIENIRSVEHTQMEFATPTGDPSDPRNVSLILGDNGTGKTTFLGAIALGCLAEILDASGFRPFYLVRRTDYGETPKCPGKIRVGVDLHQADGFHDGVHGGAVLRLSPKGSFEMTDSRFHADPQDPDAIPQQNWNGLFRDRGEGFLLLGYGATRRTDQSDSFDPSTVERSRSARYHRVAGLFEDQLALTPLASWLPRIWGEPDGKRVVEVLNATLPDPVALVDMGPGAERGRGPDLIFRTEQSLVPFWALSDGYRAFVGLVGDILYHMYQAAPGGNVAGLAGIVLIDEIDLHLHPAWQRTVVERLALAFPRVQFVFTTHSAIVAGTVPHERMFVLEREGGSIVARGGTERIFGRSAEEILLSRYFGLRTTRAPSFSAELQKLTRKAMDGDDAAAFEYLKALAGGDPAGSQNAEDAKASKKKAPKKKAPKKKASKKKAPKKKASKKKVSKKKVSKKKATPKKKVSKKKVSKKKVSKKKVSKKATPKKATSKKKVSKKATPKKNAPKLKKAASRKRTKRSEG